MVYPTQLGGQRAPRPDRLGAGRQTARSWASLAEGAEALGDERAGSRAGRRSDLIGGGATTPVQRGGPMAIVWYGSRGPDLTREEPQYELAVDECVEKLGLTKDHRIPPERLSGPHSTPRFASEDGRLSAFTKPQHVVIRIVTFEACSGFTRVTAHRIAQPPKATFVTRLQPGRLPDQAARQLPDLSTIIRVDPSSTGVSRLRGALPLAAYHN